MQDSKHLQSLSTESGLFKIRKCVDRVTGVCEEILPSSVSESVNVFAYSAAASTSSSRRFAAALLNWKLAPVYNHKNSLK